MANFTALHTALRNVAPYDTTPNGLQDSGRSGRFLVYTSDHEGHVSLVRAVDMMNLGREALRRVPSNADLTMDVSALRRMVVDDKARGDHPFCVVVGSSGAPDWSLRFPTGSEPEFTEGHLSSVVLSLFREGLCVSAHALSITMWSHVGNPH